MVVNSQCYACACVNVRISAHSPCSQPSADSEWVCVNVDDDSIEITHSEFTLRTRSKALPDPKDSSRYFRYMSLTCMSCHSLVYRVIQPTSPDSEGKEGPILPTEEWVEKEALKTSTGQLEVHKGCLTKEKIAQAESQPNYSKIFRTILPTDSEPTTGSSLGPNSTTTASLEGRTYLPDLPPLFLPVPFTPSHPAFQHIASVASEESKKIRSSSEAYIASIVEEQVRQIEEQEKQIRRQTELLWTRFRESLGKFENHKRDAPVPRKRDSGKWATSPRATSPPAEYLGNIVSIRDFVPTPVSSHRVSPGSSTPRASALSASIATSSFHYPRDRVVSEPLVRSPLTLRSPSTASSKTLGGPVNSDAEEVNEILEPFRRDMDETKDLATSLLVLDLEAQMEKRRQKRLAQAETNAESSHQATSDQHPLATNGIPKTQTPPPDDKPIAEDSNRTPEGKKPKRKVTFDIQPDVVTIKRDVKKENEETAMQNERDAKGNEVSVFDLEDELGDDLNAEPSSEPQPSLPLLETPQAARRRTPRVRQSSLGLPQSLSSIRPHSLPPPSAGPPATQRNIPDPVSKSAANNHLQEPRPVENGSPEEGMQPIADQFMNLVAANTPSHRGAWKKDSKAWKLFMDKQVADAEDDGGFDDSEDISDEQRANQYGWGSYKPETIAYSLPVSIGGPLEKKTFNAPSYHTKTSLSDRPGLIVPSLPANRTSSDTTGQPSYAERDRAQEVDPGAVDYATSSGAGDDEADEAPGETGEGRGRQRALRILQARSKLPEAGMWMSLAS